jgi:hypothetical protein
LRSDSVVIGEFTFNRAVAQLLALGVAVTRFGLWLRQRAALAFRAAAVFAAPFALPPLRPMLARYLDTSVFTRI